MSTGVEVLGPRERRVVVGKVGLALSGGGFRASFYHLGVFARLAELDVLRHIDVLSCVSGGSIVGACYWLALRKRFLEPRPLEHNDYIEIVKELIKHFEMAVATNLRGQAQPSIPRAVWRFATGEKGAIDPEDAASAMEEHFYRPLMPSEDPLYMHKLRFTPADRDGAGERNSPSCLWLVPRPLQPWHTIGRLVHGPRRFPHPGWCARQSRVGGSARSEL